MVKEESSLEKSLSEEPLLDKSPLRMEYFRGSILEHNIKPSIRKRIAIGIEYTIKSPYYLFQYLTKPF